MVKTKSRIKTILVTLICLCLILTIVPRAKTIFEFHKKKEILEQKQMVLLQENKTLKNELKEAKSPENIERLAREKLGMVKDGEEVLVQVKD